jgi:ElaB/YqjD/DUF883 family membrane-anchored ribosome-binding protein
MPTRNGRRSTAKSHTRTKLASTEQLRGAADAVISQTEKGFSQAQEAAEACMLQGREALENAGGRVFDFVRNRPIQALAIAVGAGALVALLTRRR